MAELEAAFAGLHLMQLAAANLIVLAATAVQAATGIGFALIAIPLLALVDLAFVPGPSVFVALFLALFMTSAGRGVIVKAELLPVGAGVVAGAAVGALLLIFIDLENMAPVFGGVILLAVAISLTGLHLPFTTRNLVSVGSIAGVMGVLSGIHGPPLALLYQRSEPEKARAMIASIFFIAYIATIAALASAGHFGVRQILLGLALMPGFFLGYGLARRYLVIRNPAAFRSGVLVIAAASAVALMFKG
ncbi:MAG: sulfite exporter TauE/SafE family protein [Kiloniellaceae bacterium]